MKNLIIALLTLLLLSLTVGVRAEEVKVKFLPPALWAIIETVERNNKLVGWKVFHNHWLDGYKPERGGKCFLEDDNMFYTFNFNYFCIEVLPKKENIPMIKEPRLRRKLENKIRKHAYLNY